GFQQFKHHFSTVARAMPYERARQLALEDASLLECAVLQVAGLLPANWVAETPPPPHFERLDAFRTERFEGLRALPLEWSRGGVRPTNYPARRLAGAVRLVARTAKTGLINTLYGLWRDPLKPSAVRKQAEDLFPAAVGFWSEHCTWTGNR